MIHARRLMWLYDGFWETLSIVSVFLMDQLIAAITIWRCCRWWRYLLLMKNALDKWHGMGEGLIFCAMLSVFYKTNCLYVFSLLWHIHVMIVNSVSRYANGFYRQRSRGELRTGIGKVVCQLLILVRDSHAYLLTPSLILFFVSLRFWCRFRSF